MTDRSSVFGRRCEDLAEEHLKRRGWKVLARNFRVPGGELDIVAADGRGWLVFVEVKGKTGRGFGHPAEMVGREKRGRLLRAALAYMGSSPWRGPGCRFDVVAVLAEPGRAPVLEHIEGAFNLDDI